MAKSIRTQVYMDAEQYEWLRAEAFRRRVTLSEVLRESIRQMRNGGRASAPRATLSRIKGYIGRIQGGPRDASLHHDRYAWGD